MHSFGIYLSILYTLYDDKSELNSEMLIILSDPLYPRAASQSALVIWYTSCVAIDVAIVAIVEHESWLARPI